MSLLQFQTVPITLSQLNFFQESSFDLSNLQFADEESFTPQIFGLQSLYNDDGSQDNQIDLS